MIMTTKIFLGGTCAGTTWREDLIKVLQVPYFNPVVEDWTPECQDRENLQKNYKCNVHLYVITSAMKGVYSIAEMVQSSITKGKITIVQVIPEGFSATQLRHLGATLALVRGNSGICYIDADLNRTARILNNCFKE